MKKVKTCCVLGLGYIGLPNAVVIANSGINVIGVDIKADILDSLKIGKAHFYEPGLDDLLQKVVNNKLMTFKSQSVSADCYVIAVPTPFVDNLSNIPEPNIEFVLDAASSIANKIKPGALVIIESTSPVGTTEKVAKKITELSGLSRREFNVAYCPERVIPGSVMSELINNDRVIGGLSQEATKEAIDFYRNFCSGKLLSTTANTAELVKLTENSYRDVNLAFANEMSLICDQLNISISELIKLANHHPRVNILNPGCGVGGHCIAVDPWFIASKSPEISHLIQTARKVNNFKPKWVTKKIIEKAKEIKKEIGYNPKIGCLGLTFKPDVDDIRESPAKEIFENLMDSEFQVFGCEPNLKEYQCKLFSINEIIESCELIVFLVAHREFKEINVDEINFLDYCGVKNKNL